MGDGWYDSVVVDDSAWMVCGVLCCAYFSGGCLKKMSVFYLGESRLNL